MLILLVESSVLGLLPALLTLHTRELKLPATSCPNPKSSVSYKMGKMASSVSGKGVQGGAGVARLSTGWLLNRQVCLLQVWRPETPRFGNLADSVSQSLLSSAHIACYCVALRGRGKKKSSSGLFLYYHILCICFETVL